MYPTPRPQKDGLTSQADSELIKMITRLTSKQEVSKGSPEKELDKMLSSLVKKHHGEYCRKCTFRENLKFVNSQTFAKNTCFTKGNTEYNAQTYGMDCKLAV